MAVKTICLTGIRVTLKECLACSQRKQRETSQAGRAKQGTGPKGGNEGGREEEPPFSLQALTTATPCLGRALLIPHCPIKPLVHMQDYDEQQDAQEFTSNVFLSHCEPLSHWMRWFSSAYPYPIFPLILSSNHSNTKTDSALPPRYVCVTVVLYLILIRHVKTCKTEQRGEAAQVKTYKRSCLCFCLLASFVLREGEEHVTRWDQDPPRAPRTLLEPTTGRHTSAVEWAFNHIPFIAKLFLEHTIYLNTLNCHYRLVRAVFISPQRPQLCLLIRPGERAWG